MKKTDRNVDNVRAPDFHAGRVSLIDLEKFATVLGVLLPLPFVWPHLQGLCVSGWLQRVR